MNMRHILGCLASAAVFCGNARANDEEAATPADNEKDGKADEAAVNKEQQPKEKTNMTLVTIETSMGTITAELDAEKAPVTVANFLAYVDDGHYTDTIFHRVIPNFMIQGGGFTENMTQKKTKPPIKLESRNGLKNNRGTLAMARTPDPNSATSQFFINHKDNANLDFPSFDGHGYAVFGRVTDGMDVVDAIAKVKTGNRGGHGDVPQETVLIKKISRKE